ncbi:MAG: CatB-related O-acetyltransferase [Lachnospiraceae bacterium]|nr:CatB-related O-acetyltransferase [Lachnospiraceae bacterium]
MKQGSYLHGGCVLEGRNYIGKKTTLNHTSVGFGSQVNDGGDLTDARIGRFCSIGTGVATAIGRHPLDKHASTHTAFYDASAPLGFTYVKETTFQAAQYVNEEERVQVMIGNDVWIGNDVRIFPGVTIGDGAVVGTGAVVTKDLEPYGIYAGVPAKLIRKRYDVGTIDALLDLKWWEKDEEWLREHSAWFADVEELIRNA